MASDVEICNMALAHLGSNTLITSLNPPDGSIEASHCKTFYPHVRRLVLDVGNFDFALRRQALSTLATNPSNAWQYAYALPSDCLSPLRILRGDAVSSGLSSFSLGLFNVDPIVDELFRERGSSEFEVENQTLFTNEPDAVLKYKADVTDQEGLFPPAMVMAFSMLLAGFLAGPIIKGDEGRKIGAAWMQAGNNAIASATATDGNNRSERAEHTSAFVRARA